MFTITYGNIFKTKYKCIGLEWIKEAQCVILILQDQERVIIPLNKKKIVISKEWYEMVNEKIKKEVK